MKGGSESQLRQENAALREILTVYSELSGMAAEDADVACVLHLMTNRLGVAATVVDEYLRVVAAVPGDTVVESLHALSICDRALERLVTAATRTRRAVSALATPPQEMSTIVVAPIVLGGQAAAYLVTLGRSEDTQNSPDEGMQVVLTEHAAMICGIVLARARVVAAAAGHARRDLFEGLLSSSDRSDGEIEAWARHLGIKPDQPHRVLVARLAAEASAFASQSAQINEAAALVEYLLSTRCRNTTVINRDNEIVAVIEEGDTTPAQLSTLQTVARMCDEEAKSRYPDVSVSVGIGNCYPSAAHIRRSYLEALRASDTTKLMAGLGSVAVFAELGIHRLLARVTDSADLRSFSDEVLSDLVRHDRANNTDYIATLTVYFSENGSPQRTGRRLHLHPNTVTYRVRRIEEITGLSLSSYADRLVIQVALEIASGLGCSA